jgi:hypothetical protein
MKRGITFMDGSKTVYLANGDALILLDGQYFISSDGNAQPTSIDREAGELLVFETCNRLKDLLEAKITFINNGWEEERYVLQSKVEQYEKTLSYYADRGFNKAKEILEDYK